MQSIEEKVRNKKRYLNENELDETQPVLLKSYLKNVISEHRHPRV
jgi:hypothetical protein